MCMHWLCVTSEDRDKGHVYSIMHACYSFQRQRSGSPYNSGEMRSGEGVFDQPHSSHFPAGNSDQVCSIHTPHPHYSDTCTVVYHCGKLLLVGTPCSLCIPSLLFLIGLLLPCFLLLDSLSLSPLSSRARPRPYLVKNLLTSPCSREHCPRPPALAPVMSNFLALPTAPTAVMKLFVR